MARNTSNLLELDVDKLFENHKIEEIVEISKLLDAEIERKRVDLRSMVGDRYKDVLAASDAITNMKTISQGIVDNIDEITNICEKLIANDKEEIVKDSIVIDSFKVGERTLIVQIRLLIFINEQIWIVLDKDDNLSAAQFYLLAQHIYTGLEVTRKEDLDRLRLLQLINANLNALREQIISRIKEKLECVELTAEDTSQNLNALLLLKNQSTDELLDIFMSHRKTALQTVIKTSYGSVRVQVCAMMRCIITTIYLLHDCFISWDNSNKGLIWQQLENIINDSSVATLSKVNTPNTQLMAYVPEIINHYRPKCDCKMDKAFRDKIALEEWLKSTKMLVQAGLETSLKLVTNVKGLHLIREEVIKIELPSEWAKICLGINLDENFNIWSHFFQELVTRRVKELISKKVQSVNVDLQADITKMLDSYEEYDKREKDLSRYVWIESNDDISHYENNHAGLSMKTLGYSQNIVTLCGKLDGRYLDLLRDMSQYLYRKEYQETNSNLSLSLHDFKSKRKITDKDEIENHLRIECTNNASLLITFLQDVILREKNIDVIVPKSLICARFLQAITNLSSHFAKCCSLNGTTDDWLRICNNFNKCSIQFWNHWVDKCVRDIDKLAENQLINTTSCSMISILPRWDTIEIQEQTEEKVFKSQIRVPLKPSLALQDILMKLNDNICNILPHTLPKSIHLCYIEKNVRTILDQYKKISTDDLNQNQALQFLFDVKFLTVFCIPIDHLQLIAVSQEICDNFRARIDPFDLDVFYSFLQTNVKRAVVQSQMILGCLLPSSVQLANLGILEKSKEQDNEPSILALSTPMLTSWFPLLPVSAPTPKIVSEPEPRETQLVTTKPVKVTTKKPQDSAGVMRSSAAALFGGLTTDWFS